MLSSPSTANASSELTALQDWEELSSAEAAFFYQRSRINWLALGDGSTSLFHRYAASRQAFNHIHFLFSESGKRVDSQSGIQELCVHYFSGLLGSPVTQPMFIQSDMDLLFNFKCSEEQVASFKKGFSAIDIKEAFFSLPRNKTGGQDGYSAEFFTTLRSVIGPEVTESIM